jgi:uncharacterized damage-inducible protein DinB
MAWADRAGLDVARSLDEGEYCKDRGFSFGSIHKLLVHQMVAEATWLERVQGRSRLGRLHNEIEHPTRELLVERWPTVHAALLEFAGWQTELSVNAPMTVRRNNGEQLTLPLGAMLMHVADHGSYHRGQLASMFKEAGVAPAPYAPYFRFAQDAETQS